MKYLLNCILRLYSKKKTVINTFKSIFKTDSQPPDVTNNTGGGNNRPRTDQISRYGSSQGAVRGVTHTPAEGERIFSNVHNKCRVKQLSSLVLDL